MVETVISKPIHKILTSLTGESRLDVALHLATKELVRLKLQEVERQIDEFENKYSLTFEEFKRAWENDQIADKHSYDVEKTYWEWEASIADRERLQHMLDELP